MDPSGSRFSAGLVMIALPARARRATGEAGTEPDRPLAITTHWDLWP
jgi:hypothetical protein